MAARVGTTAGDGLATGAGFSQGFPLTDPASCNDIGRSTRARSSLVTDAFCYSTTDIFAAGFQDHEIGTILGVHDNTGAGGANVWDITTTSAQTCSRTRSRRCRTAPARVSPSAGRRA